MSSAHSAATTRSAPRSGVMSVSATRIVVSTFGVLASLAGIEHGVGEILQGPVQPAGLVILSWPDSEAMRVLAGEPAMTVVPNLLVSGIAAVLVAVAVGVWSVMFIDRRYGGLVLILLSLLLLLTGGGFGPPLMGVIVGVAASRMHVVPSEAPGRVLHLLAASWSWFFTIAVLGFLSLLPGVVLLNLFSTADFSVLVAVLPFISFASLILALIGARARDRTPGRRADQQQPVAPPGQQR